MLGGSGAPKTVFSGLKLEELFALVERRYVEIATTWGRLTLVVAPGISMA